MTIKIPHFDGLFITKISRSEIEKFFNYREAEEEEKVKLIAYWLKGGALAW